MATQISYGSDITFTGEDITPALTLTSDSSVVLEALSFRLQSNPGSLWYDPDYGYNINNLLKAPININGGINAIISRIENECYKDSRVFSAKCTISNFSLKNNTMKIAIEVTLVNGEQNVLVFDLTTADLSTKDI
jgi:phage baseplate assembly protein W